MTANKPQNSYLLSCSAPSDLVNRGRREPEASHQRELRPGSSDNCCAQRTYSSSQWALGTEQGNQLAAPKQRQVESAAGQTAC